MKLSKASSDWNGYRNRSHGAKASGRLKVLCINGQILDRLILIAYIAGRFLFSSIGWILRKVVNVRSCAESTPLGLPYSLPDWLRV